MLKKNTYSEGNSSTSEVRAPGKPIAQCDNLLRLHESVFTSFFADWALENDAKSSIDHGQLVTCFY